MAAFPFGGAVTRVKRQKLIDYQVKTTTYLPIDYAPLLGNSMEE